MHWHTKIMKYGLGELVTQLFGENKDFASIARACNEELRKRQDHERYTEITPANIKQFVAGVERDSNKLREYIDLQKAALEIHDVTQKIREVAQLTWSKLSEAYEQDNVLDYTRLHASLMDSLKTLATIEGKLRNYVTLEVFNAHIIKVVKIIVDDPELSARDKRRLVSRVRSEVAVSAESLQTADATDPTESFDEQQQSQQKSQ